MKRKALVIAGNIKQYQEWIVENKLDPKEYVYATEYSWPGLHNIQVLKVGTWWARNDLDIERMEYTINPGGSPDEGFLD